MVEKFDASKIQWEEDEPEEGQATDTAAEEPQESFEQMLAGSEASRADAPLLKIGELVSGLVNSVSGDADILIDLGFKHVGIISRDELLDEDGTLKVQVGDTLEAIIVGRKGSEVNLSMSLSTSLKSKRDLEVAYANKIPVKGRVTGDNKGGFEVTMAGLKAFCPVSQIDLRFVEDKAAYIGKEFEFIIEKMSGQRHVVVSRSAALRKQAEAKLEQIQEELSQDPDKVYEGVVTDVRDFGAFVDFGGVEGMVYRTELVHGRVDSVFNVIDKGKQVRVKVLKIERVDGKHKISLSMKAAAQDPWDTVLDEFRISKSYPAKVVRLEKFGAFVELRQGIEGLVHISEMSWVKRINHPSDILKVGDSINIRILSLDPETRRMQLSLKSVDDDPWHDIESRYPLGALVSGNVETLKSFGAIVNLAPGLSGLLPITTLKRTFGNTYRKDFIPGSTVEVKVAALDMGERKILLSLKEVDGDEDSFRNYEQYVKEEASRREKQAGQPGENLGALGMALKAKLNKKK